MALTTIEPFGINSSNTFTFGGVTATGNVTANNVTVGNTVSVTGNVAGNFFIGNGSQLTGLPEGYANANVAAYLPTYTGNLASLQGNVTTTANISANYVLGNGSQLTGLPESYSNANVAAYLPTYSGNISADNITANTFTGNITGGSNTAGTVTASAQPNITSVGTLTSVSVTGNIDGGNIAGNGAGLTSIPGANVTGQVPNALVSGTVTTAAQPNITSVGTLTSLSSSGNITGAYILGNGSQLTGLPESYTNANVAAYLPTYTGNLVSLEGNVTTTANISGAYVLGNGSQLTGVQNTTFGSSPPGSPAQGDVWIDADTGVQYIYFDDGTSSQWAEMEAANSIAFINADLASYSGNISPSADVTYDLGSSSYRWRDLYLSGNTINLGGATIKTDAASGAIALIPEPTVANPNPSGMVVSPSGGITVVATTGGEVSGNAIANAAASPTAAPVPIDITTTPPTQGQSLTWDAANSEFVPSNVRGITIYETIAELPLANVTAGSQAYVEENNRLYMWNGVGWFNIALINTNPTITGGADPTYTFATDGTPIVLTLVASDPEGIPLTWSYQVTSGTLGNTATVSQADNVFTVTPSTNTANSGVFEITFSASDGVNVGTAASTFTLRFSAADPYYKQSVLLSTTDTNNGTNNTFVDSSTTNATVTRNGNTTQGTYSPFSPAGWSGLFDGTGDYLTVPDNTAFDFGSGDFTIECFVYVNKFDSGATDVIASTYQDSTNGWTLGIFAATGKFYGALAGDAAQLNDPNSLILNSWVHLCLTRSSTTARFFVNGVQVASESNSTTMSSTSNVHIGTSVGGGSLSFNGYISNLRVVKGTALYTANFTPSTTPLTAVAGTSLLTLQSNRFVDNSTNNFAITRNGDTRITPFSPFDPSSPYSTSVNGGSAYFDGTGDYLSAAASSGGNLSTGDFTLEMWFYPTGASDARTLAQQNESSWRLNTDSSSKIQWVSAGAARITSTNTFVNNQWNHVAVTASSGTYRLFLNGVVQGTDSTAPTNSNDPVIIGVNTASIGNVWLWLGYISNLRIVKGTAVYTTNFTLPTAPVTAIAGTSLLLNFTNANIYDQTGKVDLETVGDAKTSTSVVKYSTTSMAFDGTGDYLLSPASSLLDFGTGDFTIETWVNFTALSTNRILLDRWASGNAGGWQLYWRGTGTSITFFVGASVIVQDPNGSNITTGTWYHIAVTRSGTTVRLFVNGTVVATATSSLSLTNTLPLGVGIQTSTATNLLNGYLSDTRITKGVARYTANFTPPTAQLGFSNPE